MLEERVQRWTQEWREEGRQEGLKEGEAATLTRLLEYKFGPLAAGHRKRIRAADSSKLQEWTRRILTAERLEEIFTPPDSAALKPRKR
ncbi:MAG: hypothetical protein V3T83_04930 [Acidobacteriota bacterium]